jgi:hypothetical protein
MATSLTGQNVNTTYDSLIKVGDNGVVTSTLKQVSDGLGNEFPMQISSTQVIITGSLSGSATTAISASFATNATSASYAATASVVTSASYAATASVAQQLSATDIATNGNYKLLFKSGAATIETAHTDAGVVYNPSTNRLTVDGVISASSDLFAGSVQAAGGVGGTAGIFSSYVQTTSITASGGITSSFLRTGYVDFDINATPAFQTGRVNWIDDTKTLAIDTELSGLQIEVGHQNVLRVRNQTGVTILKGRAVYISGSSGNRPLIYTASFEGDPTSAGTVGLVAADIGTGNNGYVISDGLIRDINTTAYTAGQVLYLSSSGQLTTTPPISPLHEVRIGKVVTSATSGIIHVDIMNGYEIGELHDVVDNTTNSAYGDLLIKSGSVWKDGRQLTGSYGLTGSLNVTSGGITSSLFGTASWALNVVGGGGGGGVTINNNVDNYLVTATGTTNTLNGESALQYSSSILINTGRTNFSNVSLTSLTTHQFRGNVADTFANFLIQDSQGDDVFKVEGDVVGSDLLVSMGDLSGAGNGTNLTVNPTLDQITLDGEAFINSIRIPEIALGSNGQYQQGAVVAEAWSTTGPTLTAGRVVYLSGSGQWGNAIATAEATSTGVLGVVTNQANQNDILLHGIVQVSQSLAGFTNGNPVYLATASAGTITQTPPSTVGHVARYVGYVLDSGSRQIYFNPDFTWIEL